MSSTERVHLSAEELFRELRGADWQIIEIIEYEGHGGVWPSDLHESQYAYVIFLIGAGVCDVELRAHGKMVIPFILLTDKGKRLSKMRRQKRAR